MININKIYKSCFFIHKNFPCLVFDGFKLYISFFVFLWPSNRFLILRHACLIFSAFCLNIHSWPYDQILWTLLILFIYHSLFRLSDLILLLARPFNQNKWSSFFFLLWLSKTMRLKIRVLINLIFLFVHDHSTKN